MFNFFAHTLLLIFQIYFSSLHAINLPKNTDLIAEEVNSLISGEIFADNYDFSRISHNEVAHELLKQWAETKSLAASDGNLTLNKALPSCNISRQLASILEGLQLISTSGSFTDYHENKKNIQLYISKIIKNEPKTTDSISFSDRLSIANFIKELARKDQYWDKLVISGKYFDKFNEPFSRKAFSIRFETERCRSKRENNIALRVIFDHIFWPIDKEYGKGVSLSLWLLTQHQDHDVNLQKRILKRLEKVTERGEVDGSYSAYLHDRIAINSGNPQKYGTQIRCLNGSPAPKLLEKPEKVDVFRQEKGLMPLSDYLESLVLISCKP